MGTINLTRLSAWTAFFVICFTSLWLFGKSDANAATKIDASPATVIARSGLPQGVAVDFGTAPKSPTGALSTKTIEALDTGERLKEARCGISLDLKIHGSPG